MKFLIVEDVPIMRKVIMNALRDRGTVEIVEASDGVEAMDALQRDPNCFVITDWIMPNMNGIELVRAIRTNPVLKELPILMVTTNDEKSHVVKAMRAGVDDYIIKPFTQKTILRKVEGVLLKRKDFR